MKSPVLCLRCQKVSHFLVLSSITGTLLQCVRLTVRPVYDVSLFMKLLCFCFQQLYQTLTDYDIRFYMYEILKVSFFLWLIPLKSVLIVHMTLGSKKCGLLVHLCSYQVCACLFWLSTVCVLCNTDIIF